MNMNKADEIRDKIRQMRYLIEEKKFIDDLIHKLDEQKNRLNLEDLSIRTMISNRPSNNGQTEDEEVAEDCGQEIDNNYLYSGTPCRPIEEPIVDCIELNEGIKQPKAVAEAIDLDVRKVLLKLASGGHQEEEEEEYEDDH